MLHGTYIRFISHSTARRRDLQNPRVIVVWLVPLLARINTEVSSCVHMWHRIDCNTVSYVCALSLTTIGVAWSAMRIDLVDESTLEQSDLPLDRSIRFDGKSRLLSSQLRWDGCVDCCVMLGW